LRRPAALLLLSAALWLSVAALAGPAFSAPNGASTRWRQLEGRIGPGDALVVSGPDGRRLLALHEKKSLIPASILKLVTVLAGFDTLGPDYRFPTDFYLDPAGDLKIKGYGDPMLVSEVVARIARDLADRLGPEATVADLVLDDSYFAEPLSIPGVNDSLEPYDAPNGALCVNFNTVFFSRGPDGALQSAEPQTPLLAPALKRIRASGLDQGRIVLSRSRQESLRYAGHLFAHFLAEAGVAITGEIRPGRVDPAQDRLLYRHESPFTLEAVAGRLLEFSNNFIANQILISAGARRFSPPGTLEKGVRAAEAFGRQKLALQTLRMAEGSGISRQNRITAADMMTVLEHFLPYRHLLVEEGPVRFKTGTLSGIQTRAGYIETPDGLYRFVLLINTPGRRADPIVRKLVGLLTRP
jgi:D-alanyl-D-alanine carboxypeptidase/D-alanyl-D-alanine-endopeptidase (penicillin-binding protein 4)